jgi:hypothetical protein
MRAYRIGCGRPALDNFYRILQCYLNTLAAVGGATYAVGVPVDHPAMILSVFDPSSSLLPPPPAECVLETFDGGVQIFEVTEDMLGINEFDSLLNHITSEMNEEEEEDRLSGRVGFVDNSLYLHNTPVVLTIQGNMETEDESTEPSPADMTAENMKLETEEDCVDRGPDADQSEFDDVDIEALTKEHEYMESVFEMADDVSLLGSFHFKKRNFHLAKIIDVGTLSRSLLNG